MKDTLTAAEFIAVMDGVDLAIAKMKDAGTYGSSEASFALKKMVSEAVLAYYSPL